MIIFHSFDRVHLRYLSGLCLSLLRSIRNTAIYTHIYTKYISFTSEGEQISVLHDAHHVYPYAHIMMKK